MFGCEQHNEIALDIRRWYLSRGSSSQFPGSRFKFGNGPFAKFNGHIDKYITYVCTQVCSVGWSSSTLLAGSSLTLKCLFSTTSLSVQARHSLQAILLLP